MTPTAILDACTSAGLTVELSQPYCDSFTLLVSPRERIAGNAPLRTLITEHRDALIEALYSRCWDAVYPPVETDTPAIRWACSPWPADAPELLVRSSHYHFVDESQEIAV